jgi:hypothetical protein
MLRQLIKRKVESFEKVSGAKANENRMSNVF